MISSEASCRRVCADESRGTDGVEQGAGLPRGQELLRPAGDELEQQLVQPVERLGAGAAQLVAAVGEQPQRDGGVVDVTCRRPGLRRAATATQWASAGSVLRPWPVSNTRARADSFAGTSSTVSPSATRRWAMCRPMPLQPSTAQTRSWYCRPAASIAGSRRVSVPNRPCASTCLAAR